MKARDIGLAASRAALVATACVGADPDINASSNDRSDAGTGDGGSSSGSDAAAGDSGAVLDAADDGADAGVPPPRVVFVTSQVYTPIDASKGVGAYDTICNQLAKASPIAGVSSRKFLAWMSTSAASAAARTGAASFTGRYELVDGTMVAQTGADLLDGTLVAPINRDEKNFFQAGKSPWTGTMPDGALATGENCDDWTGSASASVTRGSTSAATSAWTKNGTTTCSGDAPIYCFEVP